MKRRINQNWRMVFSALPREMRLEIFSYLSYKDLRRALLVCREWRNIGEDPRLWRDVAVTLDCGNVELTRTVLGFRSMCKRPAA